MAVGLSQRETERRWRLSKRGENNSVTKLGKLHGVGCPGTDGNLGLKDRSFGWIGYTTVSD
ncbi:Hypothetical protein SMAX5B_015131 [Scophthalmus maximus]|uniref:Uncharacterized protein n=1 Tax=Scophthalmus maximus TaxID=52904 RepID=A0A2U9CFN1_SCOMX|nr:Hypothetical protein SMAX5B_015131 [Scophthalmus maximus]